MPERPFVTVIIPTLNEEKYIRLCLSSAYAQSYPGELIEILIVDGCSKDRTIEIVREQQISHSNISILKNKKRIQSSAFNLGVHHSKGSIIIRWDAHCIYDPDYIHYCVLNHCEGTYGNVGGSITVLPGSETLMSKNIALISSSVFGLGGAAFRRTSPKGFVDTVPFGAFRKDIIIEIGPMNDDLHRGEDNEYNSRIRQAGYTILLDPRIKSSYYARKDLKSFLKQMYANGFSVGVLLRLSKSYVGIRHIIPMLFFLFIPVGFLSSLFTIHALVFLSAILVLYILLDIFFAVKKCYREDIRIIPLMIYSVFLVHICYGSGTLQGLLRGRFEMTKANA
jgi:glycosyltransferase involved in cell wall biosynthesis